MSTPPVDGAHDFDFHVGDWTTHLERLDAPLTGSDRWISYDGTTAVRPVWDGRATLVELDVAGAAGSIRALSLRLYNTSTGQWSLHSSSLGVGTLFPPAFGRFAHGRGEFYGQETYYLVTRRRAHYLLTVKGNQPALHTQLAALPWADVPTGHTAGGEGHGRIEQRTLKVVTVTAGINFPHAAQALQITRRTRRPEPGNGAPRPSTRSPTSPPRRPNPISSPTGSAGTGTSRTSCRRVRDVITTKTDPRSAPPTARRSWPACGTWRSAPYGSRATPTSPTPTGTIQAGQKDPSHYC